MANLLDYIRGHKFPVEAGWPGQDDTTIDPTTHEVDYPGDTGGDSRPTLRDRVMDDTSNGRNGGGPGPQVQDNPNQGNGPSPAFTEDPTKTDDQSQLPDYHDQSGGSYSVSPSMSSPQSQRPPGGSLKSKILKSLLTIAPVALGGAIGGAPGATGAGEGELEYGQQQVENQLKNRQVTSTNENRILQQMLSQERINEQAQRDANTDKRFQTTNNRLLDSMQQRKDDKSPYVSYYTGQDGTRYGVKHDGTAEPVPGGAKARVPNAPQPRVGSQEEQAYNEELKKNPSLTRTQFHKTWTGEGRVNPADQSGTIVPKYEQDGSISGWVRIRPNNKTEFVPVPATGGPGQNGGAASPGTASPPQGSGAGSPSSPPTGPAASPQNILPPKPSPQQQQNVASYQQAQRYAELYMGGGKFTGAGDEGLLEQYFDLMKPSSGFRMSQPQMKMLVDSRSWMGSIQGNIYHMVHGTWFSPEQRQQIVDTMNMGAEAKGVSNQPQQGQGQGQPQGGGTVLRYDKQGNRL